MELHASQADIRPDSAAAEIGCPSVALPTCRFCGAALRHTYVDLGMSPLCEICVPADSVAAMEALYPLHANVCESCHLVQLEKFG